MKLLTLKNLIMIIFFVLLPMVHCQRGRNKCKKFKLENGKVKVKSRGRLARLKCKKGFTMIDGDAFLTCTRQQWTGNLPKCIKSGCDVVHEIAHGEAIALFQGALMQFTCSPGYALNGSPFLSCDGNNWNASIPYCGHRTAQEDVELSCNFEDPGLCNWEIVNAAPNKGWKRGQGGPSMPGSSAPATDHSTGTESGHFLLVDAADMGTAAQMFSPVFTPPTEAPACFVFYYHIKTHATNGIRVSFKPDNITVDNMNISIDLRGDTGLAGDDGWTMYYFDLNPYIVLEQHFQIILEVLPGQGYNSDIAVDDVALSAGLQCIEYELEYEEQQNPPTTFIMKATSSVITTKTSVSTEQDQEEVNYTTQSNDLMDITSQISTIDLQNEVLVNQLSTDSMQDPNTEPITITARNVTDKSLEETTTYPNTQTISSLTSFQNITINVATKNYSDIITFGPKITIMPITIPPVITILPPTTSTPLKQRTPKSTVQTEIDTTPTQTSISVEKNNTEFPTEVKTLTTKPPSATDLTSLKYSTAIFSTDVENILTIQPTSQSEFTPPPPPHLPPHPFSDTPTSEINSNLTTSSLSDQFHTMSTEFSTDIQKVTKKATSSVSTSDTFPTDITSSFTSRTTPKKFTPPPPPPLPPHPFSEITTTISTTKISDTTINNNSISLTSTTLSNNIKTTQTSMNNKTDILSTVTTSIFSQPSFFTDTTTHATSTPPTTTDTNSQPITVRMIETSKSTTAEYLSTSTKNEILTQRTTKSTTKDTIPMEISTFSTNTILFYTPKDVSIEKVTTTKPDITTANIGQTISPNIINKTTKYSKGAIAAIAVLILVLCVLGIIAISVVVDKYKDYTKEDKLLENSEGSDSSIRFSYRREGVNRGGGAGGGADGSGHGEIRIPAVNFYGYENPGTPV